MIEIKDLKVNFGEQEVLRGIDWFITPKSRIGLVGDNGAGKTTLLRVLAGSADYEGTITMPKGHSVGYLPQDLVEIGELPLAEYLKGRAGLTEISQRLAECEQRMSALAEDDPSVKGLLSEHERLQRLFESKGGFGFDVEAKQVLKGLGFAPERDAARLTSEFSGGWKMRIALAALLLSHSDIMLLDEPTNHLDIPSREALELALLDFGGTMLVVSHDRYFINKLSTRVLSIGMNGAESFEGGYDDYAAKIAEQSAEKPKAAKTMGKGGEDYKRRKERESELRRTITAIKKCEERINELDGLIAKTNEEMSTPEAAADYARVMELTETLGKLNDEQTELMMQWEELENRKAQLDGEK